MKDATSAYIPSTLLDEDVLRYNLPPFLPQTHLLFLLSSTQRCFLGKDRILAVFLEAASLFYLCR